MEEEEGQEVENLWQIFVDGDIDDEDDEVFWELMGVLIFFDVGSI